MSVQVEMDNHVTLFYITALFFCGPWSIITNQYDVHRDKYKKKHKYFPECYGLSLKYNYIAR